MRRPANIFINTLLLLLVVSSTAAAQAAELIVKGKALEKGTRKPLAGVSVFVSGREDAAVLTEADGTFVLTVKEEGEFSLAAVVAGYSKSKPVKAVIGKEGQVKPITLYLEPVASLMEVVVLADRNPDKTAKTVVTGKELVSVAGSGGDPLRGMQALPGITARSDASANPAIRGSTPADNAYYVDFLPAGYLFHMGGIISVFNADLVEDFNIYASAFGPEFADVTGGVIDVKLRNPRTDRWGGKINVSILGEDALIEGPISKNQSIYLSGRRSHLEFIFDLVGDQGTDVKIRQVPQYYDYQSKYAWNISDDHTLTAYANGANDSMKITMTEEATAVKQDPVLAGDFDMEMSYHSQGAVLASRLSPNINNRLGVLHMTTSMKQQTTSLGHAIVEFDDLYLRENLNIAAGARNDVLVGLDWGFSRINLDLDTVKDVPSEYKADTDFTTSERFENKDRFTARWWAVALKDRWKVLDPLTLVIGGRAMHEDYFDKYTIQPRLGAEWQAAADTLVFAGWGKYHQFPEGYQVIEGMGNPDLDYLKADHYDVGAEQQLGSGWSARLDTYYKKLYDLVIPHQPENYVNGGSGKAYGAELLIKKNRTTDWYGWVSVAYSKTERKNDLTGEEFPNPYDQPVVVNVVLDWKMTPKWTLGAKWRFQSGAPFTPVIGTDKYPDGRIRPIYGELGSERLPDYHRLDLRITRDILFDTWKMGWYVEVINAYARQNVSGYQYNEDYTSREPVSQLPLIPSFGVQAEF